MNTYSVSDVAEMLNVNEETIRRWIRDGKLKAKRAVGRGGNTLYLEDIVDFANTPPRAYLLPLEAWLKENNITYTKIEDASPAGKGDRDSAMMAGVLGATSAVGTAISLTGSVIGAVATPVVGAVGIPVAGAAYAISKLYKRKKHQSYSINLNTDELEDTCTDDASTADSSDTHSSESTSETADHTSTTEADKTSSNRLEVLNEIAYAKQLLDTGIITPDEFADIKARLIAKI